MKKILIAPVITEKSYKDAQNNVYTFVVNKDANKIEIKQEIEKQFKVNVLDVRVITIPGKKVRFGRNRKQGRKSDVKKALIGLKEGQKISIFEV